MHFRMIDAKYHESSQNYHVKLFSEIVKFQITGTILAPKERSAWNSNELGMWVQFSSISGLTIEGGGVINGQGQDWWAKSCKVNKQQVSVLFIVLFHLVFLTPWCT